MPDNAKLTGLQGLSQPFLCMPILYREPEQKAYSKIKYNSIIKYWLVTQVNKSSQLKQQAMAICYSMKEDCSFWRLFGQTEDVSAELWTG